jgi:hypothetical protein
VVSRLVLDFLAPLEAATREQGIDILTTRDGRTLAVEVKGYPGRHYADHRRAGEVKPTAPSVQARHWYAQAILKAMLTREDHPDFDIAIALPDAPPPLPAPAHQGQPGSARRPA